MWKIERTNTRKWETKWTRSGENNIGSGEGGRWGSMGVGGGVTQGQTIKCVGASLGWAVCVCGGGGNDGRVGVGGWWVGRGDTQAQTVKWGTALNGGRGT